MFKVRRMPQGKKEMKMTATQRELLSWSIGVPITAVLLALLMFY